MYLCKHLIRLHCAPTFCLYGYYLFVLSNFWTSNKHKKNQSVHKGIQWCAIASSAPLGCGSQGDRSGFGPQEKTGKSGSCRFWSHMSHHLQLFCRELDPLRVPPTFPPSVFGHDQSTLFLICPLWFWVCLNHMIFIISWVERWGNNDNIINIDNIISTCMTGFFKSFLSG